MPYIAPTPNREEIDPHLTEALFASIQNPGDLNYVVTRLSLQLLMREGVNYVNAAGIKGALADVSDEFYRRFMGDYENLKIEQNGDVPEYQQILSWLREKERENTYHAPDTQQAHG